MSEQGWQFRSIFLKGWKLSFTGEITQEKVCAVWLSSSICAKHGYSFALCIFDKRVHTCLFAGPSLCLIVCVTVCFGVCLLMPLCGIGKLFSLVFGACMTVSSLCVRLCVGEAEQIKLVSSLIVFTVSSTQSVISTQTAICPNNQLKTAPVLLTFTAITASIHC